MSKVTGKEGRAGSWDSVRAATRREDVVGSSRENKEVGAGGGSEQSMSNADAEEVPEGGDDEYPPADEHGDSTETKRDPGPTSAPT